MLKTYHHYWTKCDLCGDTVICGKCGNNMCNGGSGRLADGSSCDECKNAADVMRREDGQQKQYVFRPNENYSPEEKALIYSIFGSQ